MTGRKTMLEKVRARALAIHARNGCTQDQPCTGPTQAEREQAAREILREQKQAS